MPSSTPTTGVRTWRRTDADASAPLAERLTETTDARAMTAAIDAADFVTVPRLGTDTTGAACMGYDDAYADALAAVLAERFGYTGGRRVSTSGRSHVFERAAALSGATVDFGLSVASTLQAGLRRAQAASQSLPAALGDGAALGVPALAGR